MVNTWLAFPHQFLPLTNWKLHSPQEQPQLRIIPMRISFMPQILSQWHLADNKYMTFLRKRALGMERDLHMQNLLLCKPEDLGLNSSTYSEERGALGFEEAP